MKLIFVYYGHPHNISCGVDHVSSLLMEQFARRQIECHVAYCFGSGSAENRPKPDGELKLPRERIDHKDNVVALSQYVRDRRIDLIMNQGGIFREVTRLCAAVKGCVPVALYSVVHSTPRRYLLTATSAASTTEMRPDGYRRMRHLGLLCLNPILYLRAYVKSVAILRSVYRSSDRTIVLSPSYVTEFLKLAWVGDREHRLRAVTNPISPPAAFGDPGPGPLRKKKVLYVGRMDNATKRIDLLLHIWKRVQNRLSDWSLFLLGDGKDAPALRAMAERLQLKNVQFVGHVDPQEHLRDSAILCLTSSTEGSPIVLMEAQSWGVVPIAFSSFGAVFDIIQDGVNGLLAAPFDCAQYAEKLIMLARDEHRRSTLSRNAIDTSALYSAHVIADRYVELFAEQGFFTDQATRRPRPLPVDPGGV